MASMHMGSRILCIHTIFVYICIYRRVMPCITWLALQLPHECSTSEIEADFLTSFWNVLQQTNSYSNSSLGPSGSHYSLHKHHRYTHAHTKKYHTKIRIRRTLQRDYHMTTAALNITVQLTRHLAAISLKWTKIKHLRKHKALIKKMAPHIR